MRERRVPTMHLATLVFLLGGLWLGAQPLDDPDVWWHVRTGRLILASGIPRREPWAYTALGRRWVPTAWLSDVLFSLVRSAGGWRGVVVLRLLATAAVLGGLAWVLVRRASPRVVAAVYLPCCVVLFRFLSERPALLALPFALALGLYATRAWEDRLPAPWWWLGVGWVWASVHGSWALAPVALLLAGLGRPRTLPRAALSAACCVVGAALTPVGPALVTQPITVVRTARAVVAEWQPTPVVSTTGLALLVLVALWLVAWWRTRPVHEAVWVGGITVAAFAVIRNAAPAVLLLAPVVAVRVQAAFPPRRGVTYLPAWTAWGAAGLGLLLPLAAVVAEPPVAPSVPVGVVDAALALGRPCRLLNGYDAGGLLTGLGAPRLSVAVDGRTDNYDPAFLRSYVDALAGGDWRGQVAALRPDCAVLPQRSRVAMGLADEYGWHVVATDAGWALLVP
jgi:hypothetical protein